MVNGTLVIGVGGTGKGAINWLKRNVEDRGTNLSNVKFLCIDSVVEDQYAFVGDKPYYIDFGADSEEFLEMGSELLPIYEKIRKGKKYPFISEWLDQDDAINTPNDAIDTPEGRAQNRVAGRVDFFVNANNVDKKLQNAILEMSQGAKGIPNSTWDIFIIGSMVGGTGSGAFFDTAILTKKKSDELLGASKTSIYWIVATPDGYSRVFNDANEVPFKNARSFAFYRELSRLAIKPANSGHIKYTNAISADSGGLFNFCYIIGKSDAVDLGTVIPKNGVTPAIADFVYTLIQDPGNIHAGPFMKGRVKVERKNKFSTFGVSQAIFDYKGSIDKFKLFLTKEVLEKLVQEENAQVTQSETKAIQFLDGFRFSKYIVAFKKNTGVRVNPPTKSINELIGMIGALSTISGSPYVFPTFTPPDTITDIKKSVTYTTHFFHRVAHREVINEAGDILARYIGDKESRDFHQVRGWAKNQGTALVQNFEKQMYEAIKEIFWDSNKGTFKRLNSAQPNTLMIAYKFLSYIRNACKEFSKYLDKKIKDYGDNDPVARQKALVEDIERDMLKDPNNTDRNKQAEYLEEMQKLLYLEIWQVLLEEFRDISVSLSGVSEKFWVLFGDPSQGWVSCLNKAIEATNNKIEEVANVRTELKSVPTRIYLPEPESKGEQSIYKNYLDSDNRVDVLLNELGWAFVESKTNPGRYELHLISPKELVENPVSTALTYVFSNKHTTSDVGNFRIEKFYEKFEKDVKEALKPFSIWDALQYEFKYNNSKPKEIFVKEIIGKLSSLSKVLLPLTPNTQANSINYAAVLGHFLRTTAGNDLATLFDESLTFDKINFNDNRFVAFLQLELLIPYQNWADFSYISKSYYEFADKDKFPIHIFKEEKNSLKIEKILRSQHYNRTQPICPEVVDLLRDWNSLKTFVLAYTLGILDKFKKHENDDPILPEHYFISGQDSNGIDRTIDLGKSEDIMEVMKNFFSDNISQQIVKNLLSSFFKETPGLKNSLKNALNTLDIRLKDKTLKQDLEDTFRAVILDYIQ